MAQAGWADSAGSDKHWLTPIGVPDPLFDFEFEMALSIEREEIMGHLDSGEIGHGLFSDSDSEPPLTTPEPTPPSSPTQKPTANLDAHNFSPFPPHFPLDPNSQSAGETAPTSAARLPVGKVNCDNAGKKYYKSNKRRSHAKRKRDRAEQRKERETTGHPYEVRHATRQKHIHTSKAVTVDAGFDLAGIPISAPGYIGLRDGEEVKDNTAYKLDDLVGENSRFKFKLQKWDGRLANLILHQLT